MSDHPDDPYGALPPEIRAMLEQLGGPGVFAQIRQMLAGSATGPVNWELAGSIALQLAAEGDRAPTPEERERAASAANVAEHWLDATPLPAAPDAGQLVVASRQEWVNVALQAMRPLVEPVAAAATRALAEVAGEELSSEEVRAQLESLGLPAMLPGMFGGDLADLLRPMGATLTGVQAGQVIGTLARQLLGQYELAIPTAPRASAYHLAVNVAEAFAGWELDPTEVATVLALHEGATRRLYHAVPWLEAHVHGLVARFAAGTRLDRAELEALTSDVMFGVDPEDPDQLREALERASRLRLTPTPDQRRILERLQGVVCLVGAWSRREVERAAGDRIPRRGAIEEVLRRRRATTGDGEALLAGLLGLDLKPADESAGDRFVAAVERELGPEGLRRALAHPENLPDTEELGDPARWLERMTAGDAIPDDLSSLFEELGEAPVEPSAEERMDDEDEGPQQSS